MILDNALSEKNLLCIILLPVKLTITISNIIYISLVKKNFLDVANSNGISPPYLINYYFLKAYLASNNFLITHHNYLYQDN